MNNPSDGQSPVSADKHEDVYDKIARSKCVKQYEALEDCLVDNDRDWRHCQNEVRVFRDCCKKTIAVSSN